MSYLQAMTTNQFTKGSVAVLLSGRGSNFLSLLNESRNPESNHTITLVITDQPKAPGYVRAKEEGLPSFIIDPTDFKSRKLYEQALCTLLAAHRIDLICLAGYMRLVGMTLLGHYPNRIMNIHPSLLPAFPGLDAQKQALTRGVKFSGCTVHFVDYGMDTGPIILQQTVPVLPDDTVESLASRILIEEHRLYPQALTLFFSGRLTVNDRIVKITP
jgi:phosphoribosylglycinamide formyltransferase-1